MPLIHLLKQVEMVAIDKAIFWSDHAYIRRIEPLLGIFTRDQNLVAIVKVVKFNVIDIPIELARFDSISDTFKNVFLHIDYHRVYVDQKFALERDVVWVLRQEVFL